MTQQQWARWSRQCALAALAPNAADATLPPASPAPCPPHLELLVAPLHGRQVLARQQRRALLQPAQQKEHHSGAAREGRAAACNRTSGGGGQRPARQRTCRCAPRTAPGRSQTPCPPRCCRRGGQRGRHWRVGAWCCLLRARPAACRLQHEGHGIPIPVQCPHTSTRAPPARQGAGRAASALRPPSASSWLLPRCLPCSGTAFRRLILTAQPV